MEYGAILMSENDFSFAGLIPDPLTFTDNRFGGDGMRHDVMRADMLSPEDYAVIQRMEREITAASLSTNADSPDNVTLINQRLSEFLRLLIPTLPSERITAIPVIYRVKFIEWWKSKHEAATHPSGEAQAGAPIQKKRSPASSQPTAKVSRTT